MATAFSSLSLPGSSAPQYNVHKDGSVRCPDTPSSCVPVASRSTAHCYQQRLVNEKASRRQASCCSGRKHVPLDRVSISKERVKQTSLLPPRSLRLSSLSVHFANPRKKACRLSGGPVFARSAVNTAWPGGLDEAQQGLSERPDMGSRYADTGPPSTSAFEHSYPLLGGLPSRCVPLKQEASALGFSSREAFCKGRVDSSKTAAHAIGSLGGYTKCSRATRYFCRAARKTATLQNPGEIVSEQQEKPPPRNGRLNGSTGLSFSNGTSSNGGVKSDRSLSEESVSISGQSVVSTLGARANEEASVKRRRTKVAGEESSVIGRKTASVPRKRITKKGVLAEVQNGLPDASVASTGDGRLAAVEVGVNGQRRPSRPRRKAEDSDSDNGTGALETAARAEGGVNGRRGPSMPRQKRVESDSDNEAGTGALGKGSSSGAFSTGEEEIGVNGQARPVRRRGRLTKETVGAGSSHSSGEDSDGPLVEGSVEDKRVGGRRRVTPMKEAFEDIEAEMSNEAGPFQAATPPRLLDTPSKAPTAADGQEGLAGQHRPFEDSEDEASDEVDPSEPAALSPPTAVNGQVLSPPEDAKPPVSAPAGAPPRKTLLPPAPKPSKRKSEKTTASDFVKEKMRQGLALASGNVGKEGEIDNSIDPHRLVRGELVVHKKVGIGRFRELRQEKVEGREAPVLFVYLEYADGLAKLPAHQAHRLLYRYRSPGVEGREPGLSKLKDRRSWEKRKSKGRAHIQKMVINILKLYRVRAAVSRPVYPPDGPAQTRFESAFRYRPTDHQQQAFDAVKNDMCHRTVPMDRIVCGDVGFGKTEVALRAVFRAANAGRQVAVLAPTTVLAKQHYDVIVERFKEFPEIEIAMFSRLATDREKKLGLERMAQGFVDVAVGTHALLGESVKFKDLGLLVVDEEQRFGVRQKEKMKDMKTTIDVLTLSATPIPRTLEQATRGLKDLSLIQTPPPSRRPIKTHLTQMDDELIWMAIEQELQRGGQVYYIVPRIHGGKHFWSRSIEEVQEELKEKMPDVTVDMAHGQMSGPELEKAMRAFRSGETQILLCTSIVESGLDIPNCNTIIITEVEKFGLAQIYQLRGRVGRSDVEAHAYLLYSVGDRMELNPAAELRLQALEECVDLGQGVNVAQRDLTIRGTGEVFGEKQSGKLSAEIGADLFNEMLFDSLYRAQTESLPRISFDDVKVDFVVDTLVPHDYIDCTEGRDQFLEDMEKAARGGVDAANEFYLEMDERLGPPPPGAKRRLQMLVMKRLAADLGITRIRTRPKFVLFETTMSIGAFQMLFDAIDEEKADIKNNLIYKEGSAGFLMKSLLGLPPEKEAQDAFECLMEMSKGLDSFMNLDRPS